MAGVSPNLKIGIGADTSKFDAAMKSTKGELRDLSKTGSDALGALGSAIGLNTGQISQFSNAAKALAGQLTATGKAGNTAFQSMVPVIKSAAGAIAGLGIAGAVLAFKSLNTEAEAFRKTLQGARDEAMMQAYVDTYRRSLYDSSQAGKSWNDFVNNFKRDWATISSNVSTVFTRVISGQGLKGIGEEIKNANINAAQAETLAGRIYDTQREIANKGAEISEIDKQIAAYKNIVIDKSNSQAERTQALAAAQDLVRQKYEGSNGLIALNERLASLMETQDHITENYNEETDATIAQRAKANSLAAQEEAELKSLLGYQNRLTAATSAEAAARRAAKEAAEARKADLKAIAEWGASSQLAPIQGPSSVTSGLAAPGLAPIQLAVSNWDGFFKDVDEGFLKKFPNGITLGVAFDIEDGLVDISRELESTLVSLADTTSSIIGNLVGDLLTGGDAWGNFANAAMSAFGDMAISIGRMAISTGVATLGIKAALESLNGYVAIAAGAALVALGAAVKSGLSNIASGNYSGGGYVASSTTSSAASGDFETREVSVNVTGTLQADGDQLVAVITNTQDKNYYTT